MAQDPLAQLEELLAKAKGQRGQSTEPPAPPVPTGPTPEELAAQQKLAAEQQLQEQMLKSEGERDEALMKLREKMTELAETPQDVARRQQDEQKMTEKQSHDSQMQGFEILQITKTKV